MTFAPSSLFGAGEFGYALDVLDAAKLWQLITGATAAANGQPIGRIEDVSGNANHFSATANSSIRPTYDATDADDCPIDFDGSNDVLMLNSSGLYAAGVCTIVMRIKGSGQQNKQFLSEGHSSNSPPCYAPGLSTSNTAGSQGGRYFFINDAGTTVLNTSSGVAVYDGSVHTVVVEDNGSSILETVDGVAGTSRAYTRSTTTLNRTALGCLFRAGAQAWLAASMGRVIAINRALNSTELANAKAWVENAATALTGPVGRSDETDTSLTLGVARPAAASTETDAAISLGAARPVGLAAETDTALALAAVSIAATGAATETDTATALGSARPVGQSDETDVASALAGLLSATAGLAQETDESLGLSAILAAGTGQADETDEALGLAAVAITATGTASETDDALTLGVARPADFADETDEALELSTGISAPVGLASETDEAFNLGSSVPAGMAAETDTSLGLGSALPVGLAAENDNAVQLLPREPVDIPEGQTTHADPQRRLTAASASPSSAADTRGSSASDGRIARTYSDRRRAA
jgi:hypothetical protein